MIAVSIEDGVGIIELARPDKYNCMSRESWKLFDSSREELERDNRVRSILIRSRGQHFCTGADLEDVKRIQDDEAALDLFMGLALSSLERLEASSLPVVVAVQGLCLAGGLELVLAGDVVFAGRSAKFGDQHAQYGLIPGWGGSQRLPRAIGLSRALDLMFSARRLDAEEAKSFGLVNYLVEDDNLHREAVTYCKKLCERSRSGLAVMKRLAHRALDLTLNDGLKLERETSIAHLMTEDVAEGLTAFKARRVPEFK
jgi:enoyl-CoA hydratase/carnithine racemase